MIVVQSCFSLYASCATHHNSSPKSRGILEYPRNRRPCWLVDWIETCRNRNTMLFRSKRACGYQMRITQMNICNTRVTDALPTSSHSQFRYFANFTLYSLVDLYQTVQSRVPGNTCSLVNQPVQLGSTYYKKTMTFHGSVYYY